MSQHSFTPRKPFFAGGNAYPRLPGTTYASLGLANAPTAEDVRGMLAELRAQKGWSQGLTMAVLGVKPMALRQWEAYKDRNPSSSARKLIWLLHQTLILGKTHNPLSIATWGKLDGIPLAKLERLIRRTTPRAIAEPEYGQGEAGRSRKEKDPPVSRGGGGVSLTQGEGVMRNSTEISGTDSSSGTGKISEGVSGKGENCPRTEVGFTGKVSEDKVRLANPRKVQVVLGHGRIYRRVKRRTERARKKELGKAYKRVKYEVPEGIKDGDDSWKWG